MASRIIINGRVLAGGRYGTETNCGCGAPVAVLGRCAECHEAVMRRRRGLKPKTDAEAARLAAIMNAQEVETARALSEMDECPRCKPGFPCPDHALLDPDEQFEGWMTLRR